MSSPALALDGLRPSATNSPPPHAHHQNLGGLSSPTSRASLLSGLRTGGVRSPSPSPLMEQQMQHQQHDSDGGSPTSSFSPPSPKNSAYHRRLKASAAIFTPNSPLAQKLLNGQDQVSGGRVGSPNGSQDSPRSASFSNGSIQQSPQGSPVSQGRHSNNNGASANREREIQALEDQMVAMRMQALAQQNAANVACLYGAARGQPNHELQYLKMQQERQQQMQLEILRLQALQQHQQQQAALAAQQQQQQHLLAQIHAEYERQMAAERERESSREQQHIFGGNAEVNAASSAQEQRQAAQASIQASLRNRNDRQAQQAQLQQKEFYMAMLQQQQQQQAQAQQQGGYTQEEMLQVQQMLMLQHQQQEQAQQQQWLAQQLAAQQHEARSCGTPPAASASPPPSDSRNWRSSGSAAALAQQAQAGKRDRVASSADKSISWRNKGANPSIIIDDSASDTTDGASGMSHSDSENHGEREATPETSEEDLNVKTPLRKKLNNKEAQPFGKGVPTPTQTSHALGGVAERDASQAIHFVQPRAISLAAAPRHRAFVETSAASANSVPSAPLQARRQPKGPPTEFKEINFAARISARTRREAVNRLNKLCKSPRTVAAFRNVSAPVA